MQNNKKEKNRLSFYTVDESKSEMPDVVAWERSGRNWVFVTIVYDEGLWKNIWWADVKQN